MQFVVKFAQNFTLKGTILQNLYPYLAQKYGTPAYIYDFDKIMQNVSAFKDAFNARKSLLCYALKANSNLSLLKHLASLDCGAELRLY